MSLVFNRKEEFKGRPGMHAFIVGVSNYPYLEGGEHHNKDEQSTLRLTQLTSAAISAYKLYQWLLARQDTLRLAKLATVRLLLSPSAVEKANMGGEQGEIANLENFLADAADWRDDAVSHKDNVTVFYFAGHGLEPKPKHKALLLDDFGKRGGGVLRNAFDFDNLHYGMGRFKRRRGIAGTQFYFIDACQAAPAVAKTYEMKDSSAAFEEAPRGPGDVDDRISPTFYATRPGDTAHALPGAETLFNRALIECLNGYAGVLKEVDGNEEWCITLESLGRAVQERVRQLGHGYPITQDVKPTDVTADMVIHTLNDPPRVALSLQIRPEEAVDATTIEIMDESSQPVRVENEKNELVPIPARLNPHPYKCTLPGGYYTINARVAANHPEYRTKMGRLRPLLPYDSRREFVVG
jgi:hypothetical protein